MSSQNNTGMTLTEVLICLVVIVALVLISLATPTITRGPGKGSGQMTQTLSNMKQLLLATQQMALDHQTTGDTNINWPGDTGGTFTNWTTQLIKGNYLSESDLCKLLSVRGQEVTSLPQTNNTGLRLYAVREDSEDNVVFLSTANFTNSPTGGTCDPSATPYPKKGFIIFRKAGDGMIFQPKNAGNTNLVGGYAPLCQ